MHMRQWSVLRAERQKAVILLLLSLVLKLETRNLLSFVLLIGATRLSFDLDVLKTAADSRAHRQFV